MGSEVRSEVEFAAVEKDADTVALEMMEAPGG